MKQKLALCCALIHKPAVLFLDEPTTGVDVVSRKEFWDMLARLKAEGITIMVSTPYMDEAKLCDRVALVQKGNILSIDSPEGIVGQFPGELFGVRAEDTHRLLREMRAYPGTKSCFAFGDSLHVTFAQGGEEGAMDWLRERGLGDARVERIKPGIEDCFIHLLKD
jgi:ABC-type multidrug transport system ATPase subunit